MSEYKEGLGDYYLAEGLREQEPRTAAGRAMLANVEPRWRNIAWDPVSLELTREEILAIEAEAAAGSPDSAERPPIATELLDAIEAFLTAEPRSYWLRGPAVRRLRDAYNAVIAEADADRG